MRFLHRAERDAGPDRPPRSIVPRPRNARRFVVHLLASLSPRRVVRGARAHNEIRRGPVLSDGHNVIIYIP